LDGLGLGDRVAIFARGARRKGEIHFLVHAASEGLGMILAHAALDGSEVLATQMSDKEAILEFVAAREQDVGGEA
jgi:hypothetical protein